MSMKAIGCNEVAEILGVSPRTVWNLVARKEIPEPKKIGRLCRWHPQVIEDFLLSGDVLSTGKTDVEIELPKRPGRPRNTGNTVKF